ncbi:adenylate/guanylate cyclase domain-containing protein [Leptospira wolffii]|uniref:adenylate/guanylate cyclase domain-containing protein n=1 Tax=Leptospira wolffii TaxID=409998 RepID=UPI001082AB99|nr:adenylate/guanylate cyclase domain-containing protein [Leptospira wolffii]TGL55268.1 adenylate/guanylate cyclase domain-containing protein [Leptospira wolffii]
MSSDNTLERVEKLSETLEVLSSEYDLYILFIDLCDSTSFKKYCLDNSMPPFIWISRQMVFLSRTANVISRYNGTIVKTIGDEVMATFPTDVHVETIFKCCREVFQLFDNLKAFNKIPFKIEAKASLDFGTCFDGRIIDTAFVDPIGTAVDRCARMSKHASANSVVISPDLRQICVEQDFQLESEIITEIEDDLKGLGKTKIYKINLGL